MSEILDSINEPFSQIDSELENVIAISTGEGGGDYSITDNLEDVEKGKMVYYNSDEEEFNIDNLKIADGTQYRTLKDEFGFAEADNVYTKAEIDEKLSGGGNLIKKGYSLELNQSGMALNMTDESENAYALNIEGGKTYDIKFSHDGNQFTATKTAIEEEGADYNLVWLGNFNDPIFVYDETGTQLIGMFGFCKNAKTLDGSYSNIEPAENNTMLYAQSAPGIAFELNIEEVVASSDNYSKAEVNELLSRYALRESLTNYATNYSVYYKINGLERSFLYSSEQLIRNPLYTISSPQGKQYFDLLDPVDSPYALDLVADRRYLVEVTCNNTTYEVIGTATEDVASGGEPIIWLGTETNPLVIREEHGGQVIANFGLCKGLASHPMSGMLIYSENNTLIFVENFEESELSISIKSIRYVKDYYLKDETYNKAEVDEIIANIDISGGESGGELLAEPLAITGTNATIPGANMSVFVQDIPTLNLELGKLYKVVYTYDGTQSEVVCQAIEMQASDGTGISLKGEGTEFTLTIANTNLSIGDKITFVDFTTGHRVSDTLANVMAMPVDPSSPISLPIIISSISEKLPEYATIEYVDEAIANATTNKNMIKTDYSMALVERGDARYLQDENGNPYSLDIEDGKNYLVSYTCNGVSGSQVVTARAELATEDGKYAYWLGTFSSPIMLYDETGTGFFGAFGLCSKLKAIDFASNSFEYDENNTMVFTIAYPGMSGTVTITGVERAKEYYLKEEVYNKTEVDELIANAGGGQTGGDYSVVEELPQAELGKMVYYKEKGYKTYDLSSATTTLVSNPTEFAENYTAGTLTSEMVENLDYAYSSTVFYLNLGVLDLSQYSDIVLRYATGDVALNKALFKISDSEFTDTLTNFATIQYAKSLGFTEAPDGVAYLKINLTGTEQILRIESISSNETFIYEAPLVDKDFNADNIKIADGSEFKPLKEALGVPDQISYNDLTNKPIQSITLSGQTLTITLGE